MYFSEEDQAAMKLNIAKITKYHELAGTLKLIGHRGMGPSSNIIDPDCDPNMIPENTLASFKKAIILGADGIEFDLFSSKDNRIMVIHNDQLWLHVYGAPRDGSLLPPGETTDTYIVGNKSVVELQQLAVWSKNEKIPTLIEVLELVSEANSIRCSFNLPKLILNMEFKDSKKSQDAIMITVKNTIKEIQQYTDQYPSSGVNFEDIYFCSFNHDALIHLIKIAIDLKIDKIQVAPIIKTATLFGKDNVDLNYTVREEVTTYDTTGLDSLRSLFHDYDQKFIAYDVILWDVYLPLIELVGSKSKQLHTSTSDNRTYDVPSTFCVFLLKMSNRVPVCFKCDAVDQAITLLTRKAELLNKYKENRRLLEQQHLGSQSQSLEKQLSSISTSSRVLLNRLPKPIYQQT